MTNATNLREKSDSQFCLVAPEKCHSAGDNSRYTVSCGEVGGVFFMAGQPPPLTYPPKK